MKQLYGRHVARIAVAAAILSMAGCEEFATPAELAKTQILAVRTDPPAIEPGGRASLDILVADATGEIAAPAVTWSVTETRPGTLPLGTVEVDDEGNATYVASTSVADNPTVGSIQATVETPDGPLVAIKAVVIGSLPLVNPAITALRVAGSDRLADEELVLAAGDRVELAIDLDAGITDETIFAWYSTVGEIEQYQSNPAELLVTDAASEGWIFVVVRDGRGGTAWHKVRAVVQ